MFSKDPRLGEGDGGTSPNRDAPKRLATTGAGLGAIALILAIVVWDVNEIWNWEAFLEWKSQIGHLPFFLGVALLPLFGFPSTPLFVLAGATFPPLVAIGGVAASIVLNLCLSYWLANRWLRSFVERGMKRWSIPWPRNDSSQALRVLVVIRLTPGLPTFLKNYVSAWWQCPSLLFPSTPCSGVRNSPAIGRSSPRRLTLREVARYPWPSR